MKADCDLEYSLCLLEHLLKEVKELLSFYVLGYDEESVDVCTWSMNS